MALVSIVTPVYNSASYIQETYESIKNQTLSDWEWLTVDDCSSDNSVELIKSFNDSRIKVYQLDKNSGAAVARNKGILEAKGKYITFIDSDDLWKEKFLEKTINFLQTNNETLVYTNYKRVNENLEQILPDFEAVDYVDFNRLLYNCPISMLTTIYDSEKIGKEMIPDVELREDHAMWLNVLKKTQYARALNETLGIYRIRENSVSRDKLTIAKKQFDVYYKFLDYSLIKSLYYTFFWALNGMKKYGKL